MKDGPSAGDYRCSCDHKSKSNMDEGALKGHFNTLKHKSYEEDKEKQAATQATMEKFKLARTAEESVRLSLQGTRATGVTEADTDLRRDWTKAMYATGVAIAKSDKLRPFIERKTKLSLTHSSHLARDYTTDLLEEEEDLQTDEFKGSVCSMGFDATPRQGDLFALVLRKIEVNAEIKRAIAVQRLAHVSTIKGSLNAATLASEVTRGLQNRRLKHEEIPAAMNDGCFTNGAAHDHIGQVADVAGKVSRMISLCLSHCANNAGEQAGFVLLDLFWTLIQKIFSQSQQAQDTWRLVTGEAWPTYSETRWYSKFEVMQKLADYFPDLLTIMTKLVSAKVASQNSAKLLNLLLDHKKSWQLQIELASYTEVLVDLCKLCYNLEGDGTDLPFKVAGRIRSVKELYPGGQLKSLPSTNALISRAIHWAVEEGGYSVPERSAPRAATRTAAQVIEEAATAVNAELARSRPRRRAAINAVRAATRAVTETAAQRERREAEEAAAEAALQAEEDAAREEARIAALEKEAEAQAVNFLLTPDDWMAHVIAGIAPAIEYFLSRVDQPGGDRYDLCQFYEGAEIFDPTFAKSLNRPEAMELIEKLRKYPVLNQEGDNVVDGLKKGWRAYQDNASKVVGSLDSSDEAAILSWHYQLFLRLDDEQDDDTNARKCRYCYNRSNNCTCNKYLRHWWRAAQLVALVQPSSAMVERVFSVAKHLFGEQQSSTLTDAIRLALFLSVNERPI